MAYYHGTSDRLPISHKLIPPSNTRIISEQGKKKNLDKVFFTADIGSAKIYAGRACSRFGGFPIVYRVIPMGEIECLNENSGTTVFCADWAFCEII